MSALISVIVPVYNRANYLPECVDSLLKQTYSNLEIILIDDGSTDNSPALCREYAAMDSRVIFLQGAHGGVSAARNLGLDAATGDYVYFLDSDDAIHPTLLHTLLTAMEQHNAPLGCTLLANVPNEHWPRVSSVMTQTPPAVQPNFRDFSTTMAHVFQLQNPIFGLIGSVMMARDLIGSTRFREDLFIGEDFYFIYENLIKGASSVIIPRRLYFCRHHDSNATDVYTYASFQNRWLRRQLVWENEQQLGREGNANMQKISTFYVYLNAILSGQMPKPEQKLMISFMKKNRKTLLSAMGFGMKLRFYLHVWLPFTYPLSYKLKRKLKKSHR